MHKQKKHNIPNKIELIKEQRTENTMTICCTLKNRRKKYE